MTLITPTALAFLALVPIIFLFYILRAQHERREVPSTWLWRNVVRDTEGRPSWRKPLRNLLLLLQVLIAILGAAALARPAVLGGQSVHHILLLDASLGMQATDTAPTRFDDARRRAANVVQSMQASDRATIIRVGTGVDIVDSSDSPAQLLAALDQLRPGAGDTNVRAAYQVIATISHEHPDFDNQAVFYSDGAFEELPTVDLGSARLRFETVGNTADNQAIVSLRVRRALDGSSRQQAFVRVVNFADSRVDLSVRALVDGIAIETRQLDLAARASTEVVFVLPANARLLEVSLDRADALAVDNYAQLVVSNEGFDVLLVSPQGTFMERALRAVPGTRVQVVKPNQYRPELTAGLTVFDGFVPKEWPPGNVLLVSPVAAPSGIIQVTGEMHNAPFLRANLRSPLLDSVDLSSAIVPNAVKIKPPEWASVVVDSTEAPLILEGQFEGHNAVIFAFDPRQPEVAQRIAMPIMLANAVQMLAPTTSSVAATPGALVMLQPLPDAREITVRDPNGKLHAFANRGRPIQFWGTDAIGRYIVIHRAANGNSVQQWFVVNAGDEKQSDIRPRPIVAPAASNLSSSLPSGISRELWVFLAAAGLGLLAVEWIVYARR